MNNQANSKESSASKLKSNYATVPLHKQILAGILSSLMVSPFNTIVDRSIIENASGRVPLWRGVGNGLKQMFLKPNVFFRSYEFRWVFIVYMTTYASGNLADHVSVKGVDDSILKLMITFVANTTTSLMKDKALTQRFGGVEKKSFPLSSYGLFFVRDIIAMASAFTIPAILGDKIHRATQIDQKNSLRIAQLTSPLLIQFISTPIHLLGIDLYVNQGFTLSERVKQMQRIYLNSLFLRMLRFLPTYGFGGIANMELRNYFKADKSN